MPPESRLRNFPISWFAMVMGLAGLSLAWERAETSLFRTTLISPFLVGLTGLVLVLLLIAYGAKVLRHGDAVRNELNHPIKLNFFATISISLILMGTAVLPLLPSLSFALWAVGSTLHLAMTLLVLSSWVYHSHFQIPHLNPGWFIPIVGNILVPIAGVAHGWIEVSWLFFSIGLGFWLVLLTIVFNRLIFHDPLPQKLLPTLFILIAPPAVGFLSWLRLTGELDAFARILYYLALFLTLFLVLQMPRFLRLPFFLSWWAYSFPLAAITIATTVMAERVATPLLQGLAPALLALLTVVVSGLLVRTLVAVARHEICIEEE